MVEQMVKVGDFDFVVEAAPIPVVINLLKNPGGKIHRPWPPFYGIENTSKALLALLEAESSATGSAANPTTLMIASSFGGDRSVIASSIGPQDPRSGILHGLQVTLGAEKRLRELAVYDNGFLERRETYIEDGFELVHEQFIRTTNPNWHNGNGYRRVESKGTDGSKATTVAEGHLLDNQPWHGTFVFIEHVPDDKPFESIHRLVLRTYSEGKLVSQTPDVTLGFGAKEQDENWLLNLPEVLKDK